MKKAIIAIVILLIVGFGIYYVVSQNSTYQAPAENSNTYYPPATDNTQNNVVTPPVVQPTTPTPTPTTPASLSVNIKGFAFSPSALNIKKGTKVTWTNNDTVAHTVTSDSGNLLNSSTISPGASFSFTFTSAGSVSYHCALHPMMKGSVVVSN